MPIVSIKMITGRSEAQKAELIRRVAESVSTALDAPVDTVRIMISECAIENWGIGPASAKAKGR